ncbi:hypothetical protein C8Q70DRAFT_1056351 [Cubamyces menziesii]|uniref:Uncharacterized protein n=1 Tax=Trametes cubensis TaxID=1111947 RepID=A0AAD7XGL4_9APHY|nr:hypothetical protein C8Q70DRAFT_1056351 [Cubamyces menziesii]KAJ8497178.1 hypothetical protein ONZ51_g659 [Trametes cubensis]
MLFTTFIFTALYSSVVSATALPKRQSPAIWQSPYSGTLVSPTTDQPVVLGGDFPFEYDVSSWCEPDFAPFTVYLTEGREPPVFDNVTASGALADGAFVFEFGKFVVSRFGLPTSSPPPPSNLTMPTPETLNTTFRTESRFYLSIVEEFDGCPGDIAVEYSLTSVALKLVPSE